MKPDSLHALIIDREAGELTEEVAELLQSYLHEHPEMEAEVQQVHDALHLTQTVMQHHPALTRPAATDQDGSPPLPTVSPLAKRRHSLLLLSRIVLPTVVLAAVLLAGFLAGKASHNVSAPPPNHAQQTTMESPPVESSPWARYQMKFNTGAGGFQIVQMDATQKVEGKTP